MRIFTQALVATGVVALATTGVAAAKGEPPIQPPDPPPYTVIAHAIATAPVGRPLRRTDASIDHVFRAARANAIPKAVARARVEAQSLAAAGGLTLGRPVGIARDAPPAGYYDPDGGRFGPGKGSRLSNWWLQVGSAPANTGDRRLPRRHLPSREP